MSARADTHVGIWRCGHELVDVGGVRRVVCFWELRISGSEDYVRGRTARRLAFLELFDHEMREHWPAKRLGGFLRADKPDLEVWSNEVEELVPSPEAVLVS